MTFDKFMGFIYKEVRGGRIDVYRLVSKTHTKITHYTPEEVQTTVTEYDTYDYEFVGIDDPLGGVI